MFNAPKKFSRILHSNQFSSTFISVLIGLVLWVVLAVLPCTNQYIPSPQGVISTIINQSDVLFKHFTTTSASALLGFILGACVAIFSTFLVMLWPKGKGIVSIFAIFLYSIPLIAAAPLAALLFGTKNSGIMLGCMGAFLPIFLTGLRAGDRKSTLISDMIRGYGATKWDELKYYRLPLVIRGWMIGARSGWIWAILGALLGDFTGGRWGLGTFLVGTLTGGDPSNVWAIVILCLILSAAGLLVIQGLSKKLRLDSSYDPIDASLPKYQGKLGNKNFPMNITYVIVLIVIWQSGAWILNIDGGIFAGPLDLTSLVFEIIRGEAAFSSAFIFSSFCSTWLLSFAGVALSLALAFSIASFRLLSPTFSRPIVLIILITQVTPIVAFIPFIAFYFGRGSASIIVIVILSTIYPSYIVFLRSFKEVPRDAVDIVRGFGASVFSLFIKVRLPHAAWMIVVALRLAVGRALLGAITAEYLLTGTGVGGILGQTRALLDFRIVWLVCTLVAIVTLLTDVLTLYLKKMLQIVSKVHGNAWANSLNA